MLQFLWLLVRARLLFYFWYPRAHFQRTLGVRHLNMLRGITFADRWRQFIASGVNLLHLSAPEGKWVASIYCQRRQFPTDARSGGIGAEPSRQSLDFILVAMTVACSCCGCTGVRRHVFRWAEILGNYYWCARHKRVRRRRHTDVQSCGV